MIAVGLDAPIQNQTDDETTNALAEETRSRLYRALTRAHMLALIVNEKLQDGWLGFLCSVQLDEDAQFKDDRGLKVQTVDRTFVKARQLAKACLSGEELDTARAIHELTAAKTTDRGSPLQVLLRDRASMPLVDELMKKLIPTDPSFGIEALNAAIETRSTTIGCRLLTTYNVPVDARLFVDESNSLTELWRSLLLSPQQADFVHDVMAVLPALREQTCRASTLTLALSLLGDEEQAVGAVELVAWLINQGVRLDEPAVAELEQVIYQLHPLLCLWVYTRTSIHVCMCGVCEGVLWCVCACVRVCVCVRACVCACVRASVHPCACAPLHAHAHAYTRVFMRLCVRVCMCAHGRVRAHANALACRC